MRLLYASVLIVGLAVLSSCSKQGVDLDKVKKDFTAEMDTISGAEGHKYLGYDGVDAVADGDKAKVTIKGVKFLVPGADPLVVGDIEMHAVPKGDDQYDLTDGKIPSKFSFKGPQGVFVVDIGSQSWAGLLSTKYHSFLSADAKYGGIKVSGPALQGGAVDLAEIAMKTTSDDKGNGVFDQTTTGTLKTLAITGPEGSGVFDSGDFKSELKGAKLADLRALGTDWQALIMGAGEGKPADPALVTRLKGYLGVIAALTTHMDLAGMKVKDATSDLFSAEHLVIDGGGTTLDQPKAGLSFDMSLLGLKVPAADLNPEVAKNKQFIPTMVKFGYALDDLPAKELWSAWLDLFASGAMQPGNEAASQQVMQGFGMQMVQLASQAGSAFRLTNLELEAPAARLKMDGNIKADGASPMGASGTANIEVGGLDAIADAAKQSMPPEDAAGASGAFDMVRGFSNRETTADNKVVDHYAIVLGPDGKMTINGKPFDMFGAMTGQPQQ
ncbi:MAG TPA: hypothetical protein VE914_11105 [Candidatus Angelobacter sp.]|nr:hypothetical protein [Candidatus Angelobacter sp.]